ITCRAIEGVAGAVLVAHFVGDVVDPERVAGGTGVASYSTRLLAGPADDAQPGDSAAAGGKDVPDIVVGGADDRVDVGLVLAQHRTAVAVGVGVGSGVGVDEARVVGDEHHADA